MSDREVWKNTVERLADRVDQVVPWLLPAAVIAPGQPQYWQVGSIAGEEGQSLKINRYDGRPNRIRGLWRDYNGGAKGDLLHLINEVKFGGGNIKAALEEALRWLGEPPSGAKEDSPKVRQRPVPQGPPPPHRYALALWLEARRLTPTDPVGLYLAGRGIDIKARGRAPGALRYHPALYHRPSGRAWPAMVAAICSPAGKHIATHRTWLEIDRGAYVRGEHPSGVWKAPLGHEAKMTMGPYSGGCIRLSRGASGKPWGQMENGETLLLGEGIEDVLSGMQRWPHWRAAAGVSLGSMLSLQLPPQITTIAFLRQRDPPKARGAPDGAYELGMRVMDRFVAEGRQVLESQLPVFVKDLNALDVKNLEAAE